MPTITDKNHIRRVPIVYGEPGENVEDIIAVALTLLEMGRPYAYFQFNGVLVTLEQGATMRSAKAEYQRRLGVLCNYAMSKEPAYAS